MKIEQIAIRRFGHWKNLELPLSDEGLHVVYGPNEAGKSTLMRFLRGIFYGYRPEPVGPDAASRTRRDPADHEPNVLDGSVRVARGDHRYEIERRLTLDPRGGARSALAVWSLDDGRALVSQPADWLNGFCGGVDEAVYQRVFAVGLQELQELGTLHADQVARQIYGTSLGPDGRRLLHACDRYDSERRRYLGDDDRGLLAQLSDRHRSAQNELEQYASHRDRYDALCREREEIERSLAGLQQRQADAQRQFRGLELMAKAWEPWRQVDQLRRELKSLPRTKSFPDRAVEQLRAIDERIRTARAARDRLSHEYRELRAKLPVSAEPNDGEAAARLLSLVEQRDWLKNSVQRLAQAESRNRQGQQELEAKIAAIGPAWNLKRVESFDPDEKKQNGFFAAARNHERAVRKRNRLRNRIKGWSRASRLKAAEVAERQKALDAPNLETSLRETRTRLEELKKLTSLHDTFDSHHRRESEIGEQLQSLQSRLVYPEWLPLLLWFFGIGGLAAAGLGFYQGFQQNGVAGLMWLLLGTTCGGLAWAVKSHYEVAVQETAEPIHERRRRVEADLQQTEQSLDRLEKSSAWLKSAFANNKPGDRAYWIDLQKRTEQRHLELEGLAATQAKILARRQRLSGWRQKFLAVNREVAASRQAWSDQLKKHGLPESARTSEAPLLWEKMRDARALWSARQAHSSGDDATLVQTLERKVDDAARKWDVKFPSGKTTLEKLAMLDERARAQARTTSEQTAARASAQQKRRAWHAAAAEWKTLRKERRKLLRAAGVRSGQALERRAAAIVRRSELQELLELAQAELQAVAESEKELAIVEEDLRTFHPDQHQSRREAIRKQLEATDAELRSGWERIGSIKQELKSLEGDRRAAEVRANLSRVGQEWNSAVERWCTIEAAGRALETLRRQYERNCQPETLAAASQWLGRLTHGRYRSVWTPLGQRALRVEDAEGRSLSVEQLSSGTREQLFLAMRLALVRQMRDQGIDLPMVLDDVLVNFDHDRTQTAIETLRDFSRDGQQVLLFTCHRHVAEIGEASGADAVRLPARSGEMAVAARHDERRAG